MISLLSIRHLAYVACPGEQEHRMERLVQRDLWALLKFLQDNYALRNLDRFSFPPRIASRAPRSSSGDKLSTCHLNNPQNNL